MRLLLIKIHKVFNAEFFEVADVGVAAPLYLKLDLKLQIALSKKIFCLIQKKTKKNIW